MTTKKLNNGLWVVEHPTPTGTAIEVFKTSDEAESFMYKQIPFIKFLTQLKNFIQRQKQILYSYAISIQSIRP